jgi:hypothetical protein
MRPSGRIERRVYRELSNPSPNSGDNPVNNRFAVIETSSPFSRLCRTDGLLTTHYRLARPFLNFLTFLSFLPVFFLATFFFALRRIFTNSSISVSTGSRFFALRRIHTRASRRLSTASCSFAMQHSTSSCWPVHHVSNLRPQFLAYHELKAGPNLGDRAHLDVHQTERQGDLTNRIFGDVRRHF